MKKTHNLFVKVGEYIENGETKHRSIHVGVVLEGDRGPFILMNKWFNPAGVQSEDGSILISMPRSKDDYSPKKIPDKPSPIAEVEDLPF